MFEIPEYFPLLSLQLSRVLDKIGLNELTVKTRRSTCLLGEEFQNVLNQLGDGDNNSYCFGSQSEGTTTVGLMSDTDELVCACNIIAMQKESEREEGKDCLLMLSADTPPGYVSFQMSVHLNVNERHDIQALKDNAVLIAQLYHTGVKQERHGPALRFVDPINGFSKDMVAGIKCNSWPVQANNWLNKRRPGHWPSYKMLRFAKSSGCFLVPGGHRLSSPENKDFLYRISPSLTERCLMFSFNMTQIKCYVMLKIISKLYLKPATIDGISSFHLKNVMFYIIENTRPNMWKEKYLLQCITTGLFVLLEWVINGYCPNYIIPGENLFAGRITAVEQMQLVHLLKLLIKSKGCFLFKIDTDRIGQLLQDRCNELPAYQPCLDSPVTASLYAGLKCDVYFKLQTLYLLSTNGSQRSDLPYNYDTSARAVFFAIRNTLHCIRRLQNSFTNVTCFVQKAIMYITPIFCSSLGTLMSSICICYNKAVPREAMFWFDLGTHSDVTSTQFKLASAFFCSGDLNRTAEILNLVDKKCRLSCIQPMCSCQYNSWHIKDHCIENIFTKGQTANTLLALCVMFSRQDFHCVPLALRYEMFKSDGEYCQTFEDRNLHMALIDSLPFLYYLKFITHKQLGEHKLKNSAMNRLMDCFRQGTKLYHKMTAWNLLGHCMELDQRPDDAICCYINSLIIRPEDNVAKWLMCLVLYKLFRVSGVV